MKRGQLLLAIVAALAVGAVAWFAGREDEPAPNKPAAGSSTPAADAVRVTFAYSPEKEKLLKPLIERFNASAARSAAGRSSSRAQTRASGDAEAQIASGTFKPVAWSPASSLWGRLLNFEADRPLAPDETPVDRAHAARDRDVGADGARARLPAEAARLRRHPRARDVEARAGRRSASRSSAPFKLVHTNPDFSTSGLSAVVAEYYAATGKKEGLTEEDVDNPKAREQVRDIEHSIVHYGDTTLFIADQLRQGGAGLRVARWRWRRSTLLDFNRTRGGQPKLVAIYPDGGHVLLRQPVHHARRALGHAPSRRAGARRSSSSWPRRSRRRSRRGPASAPPTSKAPVAADHGGQRRRPEQPERVLGLPEPRVLARIKEAWRARPQAGERAARARRVGLDERRGPAGARQAGARGRSSARSRRRTRRPDDLLRPRPAARAARRRSTRTGASCARRVDAT